MHNNEEELALFCKFCTKKSESPDKRAKTHKPTMVGTEDETQPGQPPQSGDVRLKALGFADIQMI